MTASRSVPTWMEPYRENIIRIVQKHRARNPRLFGSQARGDATKQSDVDILLQFEDSATLFDLIDIKHELEDLLHRKVDVVSEGGVRDAFRAVMEGESVPI